MNNINKQEKSDNTVQSTSGDGQASKANSSEGSKIVSFTSQSEASSEEKTSTTEEISTENARVDSKSADASPKVEVTTASSSGETQSENTSDSNPEKVIAHDSAEAKHEPSSDSVVAKADASPKAETTSSSDDALDETKLVDDTSSKVPSSAAKPSSTGEASKVPSSAAKPSSTGEASKVPSSEAKPSSTGEASKIPSSEAQPSNTADSNGAGEVVVNKRKAQTSMLDMNDEAGPMVEREPKPNTAVLSLGWRIQFKIGDKRKTLPIKSKILVGRVVESDNTAQEINFDLTPFGAYHFGVSRHHATMTLKDGYLYLEDLGSTNGTRINGFQLTANQKYRLRDGDEVEFARLRTSIMFKNPDTP